MAVLQPVERTPKNTRMRTIIALTVIGAASVAALVLPGYGVLTNLFVLNGGICAQRAAHSYFLGDQQLPVEARMVGIFGGYALALLYTGWFLGRARTTRFPTRAISAVLVAGIVAVALDGLNATTYDYGLFHLYEPQNIARLVTGLWSGLGFGVLLLPVINNYLWRAGEPVAVMQRWVEYAGAVVLMVLLGLLTISGWGWLLYPIALLSAVGGALLLTTFNLLSWGMLARWDVTNVARRWRDILFPISFIFAFSVAELLLVGWARYTFLTPGLLG